MPVNLSNLFLIVINIWFMFVYKLLVSASAVHRAVERLYWVCEKHKFQSKPVFIKSLRESREPAVTEMANPLEMVDTPCALWKNVEGLDTHTGVFFSRASYTADVRCRFTVSRAIKRKTAHYIKDSSFSINGMVGFHDNCN